MARNRISMAARAIPWLASVAVPSTAWAQQQNPQFYGPHMWSDGWHGWIFGPIMMFVFIAVMVMLIMFLVRRFGGSAGGTLSHRPAGNAPLDILKERFARGEIEKDEYEERRRILSE